MTWTTKNIISSIILAKHLKTVVFRNMKSKRILGIGNTLFVHSNFSCKKDIILLKNCAFRELQVLTELTFWFIFWFIQTLAKSIFILRESSKQSYQSYLQELSSNHILKNRLSSKDLQLQIISKKADILLISIYSSCTAGNFKAIL